MEIKIEKLDNEGRGIGYINNKIIFVPKSLLGDTIKVAITKETKKYYEGRILKIINPSLKRKNSECKYFDLCGGCNILNLEYIETLKYKEEKAKEIFKKYLNLELNFKIYECINNKSYRNKVIFHIKDKKIGLYDEINNIIEVNECLMISENMNHIISYIKKLNINNGEVLIRENYLGELLILINSKDKLNMNNKDFFVNGLIINNKICKGNNYFIEKINNLKFKVSYKSFFQINREITEKLFNLINNNINKNSVVLDLYCGVGTLGIVSSLKAKKVLGIDNNESNIKDANYNKKENNIKNCEFILGDASMFDKVIKDKLNTIIVDPPRNGLNKKVLKNILHYKVEKVIYISCNLFTLVRDLSKLTSIYEIKNISLLDMFPYTHHVETVVLMSRVDK